MTFQEGYPYPVNKANRAQSRSVSEEERDGERGG